MINIDREYTTITTNNHKYISLRPESANLILNFYKLIKQVINSQKISQYQKLFY
jgi:hypothetical protein